MTCLGWIEKFSQRFFDVSVLGTIACTTVFAEATKYDSSNASVGYVPLLAILGVAGMGLCIPFMFTSFIMDIGFFLPTSRPGARKEYRLQNITAQGNEIAEKAGLKRDTVSFKVKKDVGIAYSLSLGKRVVIGEDLVCADSGFNVEAILAHEIVHLTRGNYLMRAVRLLVYLAPFMVLFWWERLLPEAALLPYLFAMVVYPMKMASHWSEYNADEGSARLVGPTKIVSALARLRDSYGDADSFTHPSFTKRINRIGRKFVIPEGILEAATPAR